MADILGDTSRLGLPMCDSSSLNEESQHAIGDVEAPKRAFVELINHWEWENTDRHGLDVFDDLCFAMWRALRTVREPMKFHGVLDEVPPIVLPIEEYMRTEASKFLERFAEEEAWYFKSLAVSFKPKSASSSASLTAPFGFPPPKAAAKTWASSSEDCNMRRSTWVGNRCGPCPRVSCLQVAWVV